MLFCFILAILFITILIGSLLYGFSKLDCDVELYLYSRFGRSLNNYRDKVVWITGASSGIGEYLAYILAQHGAKLVISGRNAERLEEVKKQCLKLAHYENENILCLPFDMTDTNVHQMNFDQVIKHFNRLDILVNNAGRSQRANFTEIDYEVDKALFDVNVFSLVNLTRIVVRYFMENGIKGQIAVTSSTAGLVGLPNSATYTGSKHALHGYFECLRTEVSRMGIAITILCPGPTFSNFLDNAFTGKIDGKINFKHDANSSRLATDRCAELIAIAIINKLDQAWMALQPFLFAHYLSQYQPWLCRKFIPIMLSPERARKLRDGK